MSRYTQRVTSCTADASDARRDETASMVYVESDETDVQQQQQQMHNQGENREAKERQRQNQA
jgi:hypothetical protein